MPATRTAARGSDLAPAIKPGPDVYIGLLVVSLIAQIAAALFLYLDYKDYPENPPAIPKLQPIVGASTAAAPAPAANPPAANAPAPAVTPAPGGPAAGAPAAPAAGGAQPPAAAPPKGK
jgi:hypothetical protein